MNRRQKLAAKMQKLYIKVMALAATTEGTKEKDGGNSLYAIAWYSVPRADNQYWRLLFIVPSLELTNQIAVMTHCEHA